MKTQHEIEHERYSNFLESLNDDETAQAFFDKKVAQSKELIAQLLMAVDGRKTSKGNKAIEWSAVNLLEIFETFQIRHDNFDREDFADELKAYLYTWTLEYGDHQRKWARRVFAERGFDINGLEIETPIPENPSDAERMDETMKTNEMTLPELSAESADYSEREFQTLDEISQQLEIALSSDKTDEGVKACLKTIIYEASSEADLALSDMTLIRAAFPNIIKALPKDYGRGVYHSIHSILRFDTEAFQEFYDKRLDEEPPLQKLARQLSDLMHNPHLPPKLYNVIGDEIAIVDDVHSPENVLFNLKKLGENE